MKLEITKEKVLKASEKCPNAKVVLKELFPDVFKEGWIDVTENLHFRPYQASSFYWIGIYQEGTSLQIGWLDNAGANICTHAKENYKIEAQKTKGTNSWDNYFRILKKI